MVGYQGIGGTKVSDDIKIEPIPRRQFRDMFSTILQGEQMIDESTAL